MELLLSNLYAWNEKVWCIYFQIYPGLMVTAGFIHWILNTLHISVHIRDVCVFLAPLFSGFTSIATFLLTREIWNSGAALFAACFISIGKFRYEVCCTAKSGKTSQHSPLSFSLV